MARDLTFYVWADTHFGYDQGFGDQDLRAPIIEQLNNLPGWPYPPTIGGVVDKPEFVVLCGDAVDGAPGEGPGELAYYRYFAQRLQHPQIEVMGNHDQDPAYVRYFTDRYGGTSHAFDRQDIHFVCLNSRYDPDEHFADEDLCFLRGDLAEVDRSTPVVLFVHCRLDRFRNSHAVAEIVANHRVLLVVSAHVHKPAVFQWQGIDCVDVGQCRNHPIDPEYGRNLLVVHITDRHLRVVPWRWDLQDWERGQRWADPEATARRFTLDRTL
jgi:predicted MPP superfamily phosphohydrolase